MFHISFDVENEFVGEILEFFSVKIKIYNLQHAFIPNANIENEKLVIAYHNANELVIKYILKNKITHVTTTKLGEILESSGYALNYKGTVAYDLVKAGMLVRKSRGNYTVNLDHSLLGGPLFNKENSNEEKINGNETVQKL